MKQHTTEYAVYDGDTLVAIGTVPQLAKELNIKESTIYFMCSKKHHERAGLTGRVVIKIEEEILEDEIKQRVREYPIEEVTTSRALNIIQDYSPRGLFITECYSGYWIAIDNLTCDAWTEQFETREEAIAYLKGVNLHE